MARIPVVAGVLLTSLCGFVPMASGAGVTFLSEFPPFWAGRYWLQSGVDGLPVDPPTLVPTAVGGALVAFDDELSVTAGDADDYLKVLTKGSITPAFDSNNIGHVDVVGTHQITTQGSYVPSEYVSAFNAIFVVHLDGNFTLSASFATGQAGEGSLTVVKLGEDPSELDEVVEALTDDGSFSVDLTTGYFAIGFSALIDNFSSTSLEGESRATINLAPTVVPLPSSAAAGMVLGAPLMLRRRR